MSGNVETCICLNLTTGECLLDSKSKLALCPSWKTPEHPVCEIQKQLIKADVITA